MILITRLIGRVDWTDLRQDNGKKSESLIDLKSTDRAYDNQKTTGLEYPSHHDMIGAGSDSEQLQ
jgi:hypothetical protein